MNREWLVRSSGRIRGPWTLAELGQAIQQKKLTAIDEVCRPGQRWHYLRQVKELQSFLNSQSSPQDEITLTDHGQSQIRPLQKNVQFELLQNHSSASLNLNSEINVPFAENHQQASSMNSSNIQNQERIKMQKNQKILIGLFFLTILSMILVVITLQKSFQAKSTQEISAQQAEQMEARELANMAIWAQATEVTKNERLEVFKKINQWRIKHQYARRELLIYEMKLAKIEQVEQSVYDRLAYEFTSVSYRQALPQDLLLGPQPKITCLESQSAIENSAIKNNFSIICEMMFGDLKNVQHLLPINDELTQQNNRQLLLLLIEYYIRNEQFQPALDLLKKYQLTGTGLEESLRYQVCTRLKDGLCTTSPAK